jgi:ribulose-bisphosphate carboxylase large chain
LFGFENVKLNLSGQRFEVIYKLYGNEEEAMAKAKDICHEQTVEFPGELIPECAIRDNIIGRVEAFEPCDGGFKAKISYAVESASEELTQLLNVVFGNISIKPGIRVEQVLLPEIMLKKF